MPSLLNNNNKFKTKCVGMSNSSSGGSGSNSGGDQLHQLNGLIMFSFASFVALLPCHRGATYSMMLVDK